MRELLFKGVRLLNCLPGYHYQDGGEAEEKATVQRFCDMLTGSQAKATVR
jgi:hypothetical protein